MLASTYIAAAPRRRDRRRGHRGHLAAGRSFADAPLSECPLPHKSGLFCRRSFPRLRYLVLIFHLGPESLAPERGLRGLRPRERGLQRTTPLRGLRPAPPSRSERTDRRPPSQSVQTGPASKANRQGGVDMDAADPIKAYNSSGEPSEDELMPSTEAARSTSGATGNGAVASVPAQPAADSAQLNGNGRAHQVAQPAADSAQLNGNGRAHRLETRRLGRFGDRTRRPRVSL